MQNLESIGSDIGLFSLFANIGTSFELASRMENGLCILKADILSLGSEKDENDEQKSVKRKQKP